MSIANKRLLVLGTVFIPLFVISSMASAATIYLKNGDKITGIIKEKAVDYYLIDTAAMSEIKLDKAFVREIKNDETIASTKKIEPKEGGVQKKKEKLWSGDISLGYSDSRGNTEESQLNGKITSRRKTKKNEFTFQAQGRYSSTNDRMDAQEYSGYLRYAYSFGNELKWYNFYKFYVEHDKFSDVNYRLIPSFGYGYWFYSQDNFKLLSEAGLGYKVTDYYSSDDKDEITSVFRGFLSKKIFKNTTISEDFYIYPSLGDFGQYMIYSETSLDNPLNDKLSLVISLVDEYNSDAPAGVKKNDLCLTSSLAYKF
jgi:putative salt-induced outer membrane protein YdiY